MVKPAQLIMITDDCKDCRTLMSILTYLELPTHYCRMDDADDLAKLTALPNTTWQTALVCQANPHLDINAIRQHLPNTPLLAITPTPVRTLAPQFIQQISPPFRQSTVLPILRHCRQHFQEQLLTCPKHHSELANLVGISHSMQTLRATISKVARSDTSVLILGESGTGKEVAALSIHKLSDRCDKPFVPVNCGAIPSELLESELFGHEKGAFTGALNQRIGRFEMANGGTLFLDEIGDMPLPMQVKILRVLQERVFERIGSNTSIESNVRIIAATHQNLELGIKEKRFREDLYYRLNVFPLQVAPLRERSEDIPVLLDHLSQLLSQRLHCRVEFTQAAKTALSGYAWPGNIRELMNMVERMMVLHPNSAIDVADLEPKYRCATTETTDSRTINPSPLPTSPLNLKQYMSNMEKNLIIQSLENHQGVTSKAARALGMGRTTLIEKMRKYGLRYRKAEETV